jgi:hypothetical protein
MQPLDFDVPVVKDIHQVCRRAASLTATNLPIVEYDHGLAGTSEQMGGRQTGDARAYDADIGVGVRG